ncbi:NACHT domain-containing protein [Nocardia sp. NBC_00881]|uniref:NACHT domain-containing protein n=1 Tax=Nocardia sp. NBC_00881 TaxID=2975995 RepID=UPI00386C5589|nr:NACHT domain-containing protein [Nocardia sp. NBC_00881]
MSAGRRSNNRIPIALFFIGVVALAIWLALQLRGRDPEGADAYAGVVSMWLGIASITLSVFTALAQRNQLSQHSITPDPSESLDAVTETLAYAVRKQWSNEVEVRRVNESLPLKTRWVNGPDEISDHWPNIRDDRTQRTALQLGGQLEQIADVFGRVPSGRLVVLGQRGAGKTILASRFVLDMLERRTAGSGDPVPVLFPLGAWNPETPLRTWLADRLVDTISPELKDTDAQGTTLATRLLDKQRILPVLDGFDEIGEQLRATAIRAINADLRLGDQLLLTSRPSEYASAVADSDVLSRAAVVQLTDLTTGQIAEHLPLTTRRDGNGQTKWGSVLQRARSEPRYAPLMEVLSTPLMVMLARTVYSETGDDPVELLDILDRVALDPAADPHRALAHRLLAGFVSTVYAKSYRAGVKHLRDDYTPDKATEWLGFLARHLKRHQKTELAWWELVLAVPRWVVGVVAGAVTVLTVVPVVGFTGWAGNWHGNDGRTAWITATVVSALVCGIVGGTLIGRGRGIRSTPARLQLRAKGRMREIAGDLAQRLRSWRTAAWLLVWTAGGGFFGFAGWLTPTAAVVIPVGLAAGVFAGSGTWFVVSLIRALGVPVDPTTTVSPSDLLHTDRSTAFLQGLGVGAGGATVFWIMMLFAFEPASGLPFEEVLGAGRWAAGWVATAGAGVLIWVLYFPVWGPWLIARIVLPLTGKLPWGVMTFLDDAHRSGVLRKVGGVYEFRHGYLRDHLADTR